MDQMEAYIYILFRLCCIVEFSVDMSERYDSRKCELHDGIEWNAEVVQPLHHSGQGPVRDVVLIDHQDTVALLQRTATLGRHRLQHHDWQYILWFG